ncbi:hypothetical protein [Fervidobacterium thailandense]|uniref:Uncharacterized protein n=1 Tax=Fervidobacterium thailandense TaxID=1008305 RepID=A0A1E3G0D6_9BACT|nr:hypothetical protein [Fervidobacterium thailandense]ODN29687.1 hypothetical protein A4H02_09435 [Fervidobacterium thailandense]
MKQSITQKHGQKQKIKLVLQQTLQETMDLTSRTDSTIPPELGEPIDDDDQSYTERKHNEELEAIQLNPEVGLLPSKDFSCAVVRTERGYSILSFSQSPIDDGFINAIKSFPIFEKLDSEKLLHLLTDERSSDLFGVKRGELSKLIVLLPNSEIITLSMMKRKRGKNEPLDDKYYRIFRSIIFKHIDEINQLTPKDFENIKTFEEFCDTFFKKVGIISDMRINMMEALEYSERAKRTFREYFEFFCGEDGKGGGK